MKVPNIDLHGTIWIVGLLIRIEGGEGDFTQNDLTPS